MTNKILELVDEALAGLMSHDKVLLRMGNRELVAEAHKVLLEAFKEPMTSGLVTVDSYTEGQMSFWVDVKHSDKLLVVVSKPENDKQKALMHEFTQDFDLVLGSFGDSNTTPLL